MNCPVKGSVNFVGGFLLFLSMGFLLCVRFLCACRCDGKRKSKEITSKNTLT